MSDEQKPNGGVEVLTETKPKVNRPKMWKVVLLNDDYTTMMFVVEVMVRIFGKNQQDALITAVEVHNKGRAVAGVFTYEVAETKASLVMINARVRGHPLTAIIEEAEEN